MAGGLVRRSKFFDDAVLALSHSYPGAKAAIDDFVDALKAAGAELPTRPLPGNEFIHVVDDPTADSAGIGRFVVQYHMDPPSYDNGPAVFTLIDVFERASDLPVMLDG